MKRKWTMVRNPPSITRLLAFALASGLVALSPAAGAAASPTQQQQQQGELAVASADAVEASRPGLLATCFALELERQAEATPSHENRLRAELGLGQASRGGRTDERYGIAVTPDEAQRLDAVGKIQQSVNTRDLHHLAMSTFGSDFVGIHWDVDEMKYVVTTTQSVGREADLSDNVIVRVTPNAVGRQSFVKAADTLDRHALELLELGVAGWSYDETCGVLTVNIFESAAQEPAIQGVRRLIGDQPVLFSVAEPEDYAEQDRDDYRNPYIGGTELNIQGNVGRCTANLGWYKVQPGANSYWAITAAHCLPDQPGYTPGSLGVTDVNWGQGLHDIDILPGPSSTYFVYGGPMDVAIVQMNIGISNQLISFDPASTVLPDTVLSMGWWDWSTTLGALGDTYCHTGLTSNGLYCGALLRKNGTKNISAASSDLGVAVSKNGLWAVSTTSGGGDSGGPWWRQSGTSRWLAGVHEGKDDGSPAFTHVAYLKSILGLTAPASMW
jgi:hypothetical protein